MGFRKTRSDCSIENICKEKIDWYFQKKEDDKKKDK